MMKRDYGLLLFLALAWNASAADVETIASSPRLPDSTPWNLKELSQPPDFHWLDAKSPIRSLAYAGEPYQGRKTEVFAFYATPGSLAGKPKQDKNLPAIVLIHGGGGTAFAEWVHLWAKRGYAAIAMDLGGKRLDPPRFHSENGELVIVRNKRELKRHPMENSGPDQGHETKFQSIGGPINDHWPYHAVANAIRAHSLVRSFKEIDETRTAVTGISWGGYTTCIVASVDNRFKAAVPVYGCGFLADGESVQRRQIDGLGPELAAKWSQLYDPSQYLPACRVPIFFVNGAKDIHYPLRSYLRSFDLVQDAPKTIRIEPNMRHSHGHGWAPKEIGLFVDSHCRNGVPLPWIGASFAIRGSRAAVQCRSRESIKSATLHYTTDTGLQSKRQWQSVPAKHAASDVDSDEIHADVPKNATAWLLSVTDSRDAMITTPVQFSEKKRP